MTAINGRLPLIIKSAFAVLLFFLFSSSTQAHIGDFSFATFNMQGANSDADSTWEVDVKGILTGEREYLGASRDLVALQEVGAVPASAGAPLNSWEDPEAPGAIVSEYSWTVNRQTYYIYHLPVFGDHDTPSDGRRTNIAIVSRYRASDVYIHAATEGTSRESFGITINSGAQGSTPTTVYTIHAGSYGRTRLNNADTILEEIALTHAGTSWLALGDFNRDLENHEYPDANGNTLPNLTPTLPNGSHLYRSFQPTHVFPTNDERPGELDFAVSSDFIAGFGGRNLPIYSDHAAVGFQLGGAAGEGHLALRLRDKTKCIEVTGGQSTNGANLQLWDCENRPGQRWSFSPDGTIRAMGLCMGIDANDQFNVQLQVCVPGSTSQRWAVDHRNGFIENSHGGLCLDVNRHTGGANANGENIDLFDCDRLAFKADYSWVIPAREGNLVPVKDYNKCVEVSGAQTDNGTQITIWECMDLPAQVPEQRWTFSTDGTVRSLGKCLDNSGGGSENGNRIQLWDCSDNSNNSHQQWLIAKNQLKNPYTNKCFDLSQGSTSNGNDVWLWGCNASNRNQQWLYPEVQGRLMLADSSVLDCLDDEGGQLLDGDCKPYNDQEAGNQFLQINIDGSIYNDGKCLDVNSSQAHQVEWRVCNGSDAQRWYIDNDLRLNNSVYWPLVIDAYSLSETEFIMW
ncbi:ricin-type beta-trefoil lectin domain protein [uncultured Microbulbifer sp.]|uniref:ricin-type beta-trefoil lectin domain protein n=1 Tax=uncultured Microbulbifer sp. TaxID=348147 RepID=UPI0026307280|nr:ricin-type beta-trefoil lectin domain protein [uncultured Microbulbifer sp.]